MNTIHPPEPTTKRSTLVESPDGMLALEIPPPPAARLIVNILTAAIPVSVLFMMGVGFVILRNVLSPLVIAVAVAVLILFGLVDVLVLKYMKKMILSNRRLAVSGAGIRIESVSAARRAGSAAYTIPLSELVAILVASAPVGESPGECIQLLTAPRSPHRPFLFGQEFSPEERAWLAAKLRAAAVRFGAQLED